MGRMKNAVANKNNVVAVKRGSVCSSRASRPPSSPPSRNGTWKGDDIDSRELSTCRIDVVLLERVYAMDDKRADTQPRRH